jgi:hypothetical protein
MYESAFARTNERLVFGASNFVISIGSSFEPKEIQTGPAARGDQKTIESHLNIIQEKELKEIYQLISDRIKKLHHDL